MNLISIFSFKRLRLIIALSSGLLLLAETACWLFGRPIDNGFPSGFFVTRPEVGYTSAPGWNAQITRIRSHNVSINSEGFRDVEWTKGSNERGILMVGSTALFGLGVEKNERLSERIASYLGTTVHNAGMYGYGSPQALWALREFCDRGDHKMALYVHEYKLTRDDFVIAPARTVVDGTLINLPNVGGSDATQSQSAFIVERLQLLALRAFLAYHDLSPRKLYENWRGLDSFDEQYFLNRYATTSNEHSFSETNIKKTAENIEKMQEVARRCGVKFALVLLPGPFENRFRQDEPSTRKLLTILNGVAIIDARHVLPIDAKILIPGLDYFNPAALDILAQYISASIK